MGAAVTWRGWGRSSQKLIFQTISRHLNFRVTDVPSHQGLYPLKQSCRRRPQTLDFVSPGLKGHRVCIDSVRSSSFCSRLTAFFLFLFRLLMTSVLTLFKVVFFVVASPILGAKYLWARLNKPAADSTAKEGKYLHQRTFACYVCVLAHLSEHKFVIFQLRKTIALNY